MNLTKMPEEYVAVVDDLLVATSEGRVDWDIARFGLLQARVEALLVTLYSGHDEEADEDFISFCIYDTARKAETEHSASDFLVVDNWWLPASDAKYPHVLALYKSAERKAKRVDLAINTLRNALKPREKPKSTTDVLKELAKPEKK
jgi:hypothetical protein